ncbi:MAG: ATP-binding protein [Rhodocyclaceae bacterium]|jgi:ATP-dependent DNA helicase RecG|nr:ATP-binding protein [Rhodocyclaceae bacterium]
MSGQPNLFDNLDFFEGVDVEYKAAKGGLPRDLWETYSAFANTEGGTIWLGVTQRPAGLDLHGVAEREKMLSDFWNTVNNRGKVSANLLGNNDARIVLLANPDRAMIRIDVPRADRHQRPVYIGSDPLRGTYRRNFEGDYLCNEAEVRRMFADQSDEPADSRILEGFSLDDLHTDSLRQYRNLFGSRRAHAWLAEDDVGLMCKLGGWRRDRRTGKEGLTLAGLLMFGREQAIRDPSAVPGFQLDYRERFGEDPDERWTDRLTLDGSWEGNLFQFYLQAMLKLSVGPGIKRPFRTDAEGFRSGGTPVTDALQEALVNALIHADYAGQGGIVIDRWPDRLEFSNPGTLLISREQLLRGGVSECRNKSLQLMFQMLGVGDKAGSGIDKIRSSWAAEHWQSPVLRESLRPDRVVLELPMVSLLPEEVLADLRQRFGDGFDGLSGDEVQAVVTAQVEGSVTNQQLQGMLTMHRVDITRMLGGLVQQGFLSSDGVGRGTRYFVPDDATPPVSGGTPPVSGGTPPVSGGTPPVSGGTPPVSGGAEEIINRVRASRRAKPEAVRQAILAVCAEGFLPAEEIAARLGRSKKRVQDEFLGPMCAEHLLTMRYPETPNHKQQAYRTVVAAHTPSTP